MAEIVGRGVLAGITGTVVMADFQKLVETPVTGRQDSCIPVNFAERVTPVHANTGQGRTRLNRITHSTFGAMWGAAHGVAACAGLRGQRAVAAVFAIAPTGDGILGTAPGLYGPSAWSGKDLAVDVLDKFVHTEATGVIFDRFLAPAPAPVS